MSASAAARSMKEIQEEVLAAAGVFERLNNEYQVLARLIRYACERMKDTAELLETVNRVDLPGLELRNALAREFAYWETRYSDSVGPMIASRKTVEEAKAALDQLQAEALAYGVNVVMGGGNNDDEGRVVQ